MKQCVLLAAACLLALGLTACGQRVAPQPPQGKITPSSQY